jgi:HEAT repeat protein
MMGADGTTTLLATDIERLILATVSADPGVRDAAAFELRSRLLELDFCRALKSTCEDAYAWRREGAARALMLHPDYDEDRELQRAAMRAFQASAEDLELRQAFLKYFGDAEWRVREVAVLIVAPKADRKPFRSLVLGACHDSQWQVRRTCVRVLAEYPDDDPFYKALLELCDDKSDEVRLTAVEALAESSEDAEAEMALIGAMNDRDYSVRMEAVKGLTPRDRNSRAREALIEKVEEEEEESEIRAAALLTLGPVDGFDKQQTTGEAGERLERGGCLVTPERDALEAFDFADGLLDPRA